MLRVIVNTALGLGGTQGSDLVEDAADLPGVDDLDDDVHLVLRLLDGFVRLELVCLNVNRCFV